MKKKRQTLLTPNTLQLSLYFMAIIFEGDGGGLMGGDVVLDMLL